MTIDSTVAEPTTKLTRAVPAPVAAVAVPPAPVPTQQQGLLPKGVAQQLRFPSKLHLVLERCEYYHHEQHLQRRVSHTSTSHNHEAILPPPILWLPDGKSFKVHDKERFVTEIMPLFFGTQSFKTFQRNLNLWGFTRISKGPQKDVCSHPLFLKGFPAVCQSMKRIVLKGTGRGNRAPLGGVDVSSVQAVVAQATAAAQAAAQQAAHAQHRQQQQQQLQQQHVGLAHVPATAAAINHIHLQKQQQQLKHQSQAQQQHPQQPQFEIVDNTIREVTEASLQHQQVLAVPLSSSSPPPPPVAVAATATATAAHPQPPHVQQQQPPHLQQQHATTTVMWQNNQQQPPPQPSQLVAAPTNPNAAILTAPACTLTNLMCGP